MTPRDLLTDANALIALLNPDDLLHAAAVAYLRTVPPGTVLVTTLPALSEAFYLLSKKNPRYKETLLTQWEAGKMAIHPHDETEAEICRLLMRTYDWCDFADGTLLAAAQTRGDRRIFTFDRHFYAYRLPDGGMVTPLPAIQ